MLAGRNVMRAGDGLDADQWICQELLFSNLVIVSIDWISVPLIRKRVSVDGKFPGINP